MTKTVQIETTAAEPVSGIEIFVPLNKLKKSPKNARKVPHGEAAIEALAASIGHKGLIQNLVIEPEMKGDKPTGAYFVTAGEAAGWPICCAPSASRSGGTTRFAAVSTPRTTRPRSVWTRT